MLRLSCISFLVLLSACNNQTHNSAQQKKPDATAKYAVASAHPLATQAGITILEQGGNAFDAAIAITAALAVVEPYSSGLGGGGFWLLHAAESKQDIMLDARETAPLAATRDMYIDAHGNPSNESVVGPLAAGIPGVPAAIVHLSEQFASLPLSETLAPAIQLARDGFKISSRYQMLATIGKQKLSASPSAAKIFLHNGQVPEVGYVLKQTQLAKVLESIRDHGKAGFYQGEVAKKLVTGVQQAGGIWQLKDLQQYKVKQRAAITAQYKDLQIVSASLPSSGGIVLSQILNMLAEQNIDNMQQINRIHTIVEAMRRAYQDRAQYLGDIDYIDVPLTKLLSKKHAQDLFSSFNAQHATKLPITQSERTEGNDTTHFSILDAEGNYVAATLSINYLFGSSFVAPDTGILLNNEMDDFSIQPGHANLWGLVGNEANAIEPGKRMLSSMSPTFLHHKDRTAILGTPGGSRIISMVLLASLAFEAGAGAETMVALPRYHHQFLPDEIQFETDAFNSAIQTGLTNLGHTLKPQSRNYGNMQVIIIDKSENKISAASDPRGIGNALVQP